MYINSLNVEWKFNNKTLSYILFIENKQNEQIKQIKTFVKVH